MNNKRAISPVVATVLLITMAIIVIAIIFMWAQSSIKEGETKFKKTVDTACSDISEDLEVSVQGSALDISNGDAQNSLYSIAVRYEAEDGKVLSDCDILDLSPGRSKSILLSTDCDVDGFEVVGVIPIIKTDNAKAYRCEKNEIILT